MKFYNYFSEQNELEKYLEGNFSGIGIYFDPDEFEKKETLRSKLKMSAKNGELKFHLNPKKQKPLFFSKLIREISILKEDFCEFQTENNISIKIQAMTKNKMHIHIFGCKNDMNIIYISGVINRNRFF